ELLFGTLAVVNIGIDPIPSDHGAFVIGHLFIKEGRRRYLEPAVLSVVAAKAYFCRASLLGLGEILPPRFELFYIVLVDGRFPLRLIQTVRQKPGVIQKSLVEEIQGAIRQSRPREHRNAVDERADFQGLG